MLARSARWCTARPLATSSRSCSANNGKFVSPKELVQKKWQEDAEQAHFRHTLAQEPFEYKLQLLKENKVDPTTQRPVPLNVELLQYKPLRLEPTHGHKVAQIRFRGYEESELVRASELAARSAYFLGIPCAEIEKLKTEKRLYTVIRSPFAQAKSKENFHRVTYNRRLTAFDANPEVVDLWLSYINKHALDKVEYSAKIHTRESVDFAEQMGSLAAEDLDMPAAYKENAEDPIALKVQQLLQSDAFKKHMNE